MLLRSLHHRKHRKDVNVNMNKCYYSCQLIYLVVVGQSSFTFQCSLLQASSVAYESRKEMLSNKLFFSVLPYFDVEKWIRVN